MQYKGQSAEGVTPMKGVESEHPELIFTEDDRKVYQEIVDGVRIADGETTERLLQQVEVMKSHQAAYFLGKYMQLIEGEQTP